MTETIQNSIYFEAIGRGNHCDLYLKLKHCFSVSVRIFAGCAVDAYGDATGFRLFQRRMRGLQQRSLPVALPTLQKVPLFSWLSSQSLYFSPFTSSCPNAHPQPGTSSVLPVLLTIIGGGEERCFLLSPLVHLPASRRISGFELCRVQQKLIEESQVIVMKIYER